jgi:hypothetical protein
MRPRGKLEIETDDVAASGSVPAPLTIIRAWVGRGGQQWKAYEALPLAGRKEWDAFEEILMRLASHNHLYVSGLLDRMPAGLEAFASRRLRGGFAGLCRVPCRTDLHHVLTWNPLGWLGYLVSRSRLSAEDAMRLAKLLHKHSPVSALLFEWCPTALYGLEDGDDHDSLRVICRQEDRSTALKVIRDVLALFSDGDFR